MFSFKETQAHTPAQRRWGRWTVKFPGIMITESQSCHHTSPPWIKKAQKRLYVLQKQKPKFHNQIQTLTEEQKKDLWKDHRLMWFVHGPGQEGSTNRPEHQWCPSTEHQRHLWSEMSAQSTKDTRRRHSPQATVCSPCCPLSKDTEVSAAIPPN